MLNFRLEFVKVNSFFKISEIFMQNDFQIYKI